MKGRSNIRQYCVIGYPVAHSLSPKIHNRAFRKLKIPARYRAILVSPYRLSEFMSVFRENFAGANVTIPHKERVIKFLDELSPEARAIGAVNTIVNRGGRLVGYNTDVFGVMAALEMGPTKNLTTDLNIVIKDTSEYSSKSKEKLLKGKYVVVLGAGGAARAVVYGLRKAGARVIILNRTLARARRLAREFNCDYGKLGDFARSISRFLQNNKKQKALDIIVNTTSLGMWPQSEETSLPDLKKILKNFQLQGADRKMPEFTFQQQLTDSAVLPIVMDIIYRPRLTRFLRDARSAGCKIITGDKMFLAQAAASFRLWTRRSW